jgi:16S rRNA (cytidine1402-2'-O)-methyltransferase
MIILLPNFLSDENEDLSFFPRNMEEEVKKLFGLIAESRKSAVRFLLKFTSREKANSLPILILNEHTTPKEVLEIFSEVKKSKGCWGLISDGGLPAIADPGSKIVALAHLHHMAVRALSGPCSIIMGLMLSGLSGQKFCFHGYLPKREEELIPAIRKMERRTFEEKSTQIFIEAPYRSDKLLNILISTLKKEIKLVLVSDLTLPSQTLFSSTIEEWQKMKITIGKRPTIFLFGID